MGTYFGSTRSIYEQNDGQDVMMDGREFQSARPQYLKRGEIYNGKGRIAPHISSKNRELGRAGNPDRPYCQKTSGSPTSLKRHIHNKICHKLKNNEINKSRREIWKGICRTNNSRNKQNA